MASMCRAVRACLDGVSMDPNGSSTSPEPRLPMGGGGRVSYEHDPDRVGRYFRDPRGTAGDRLQELLAVPPHDVTDHVHRAGCVIEVDFAGCPDLDDDQVGHSDALEEVQV